MTRNGLKCPSCGNDDMTVLESRMEQNGTRRRVRMCLKCGKRITTHEIADMDIPTIREHRANNVVNKARAMLEKAIAALDQTEQNKQTDVVNQSKSTGTKTSDTKSNDTKPTEQKGT